VVQRVLLLSHLEAEVRQMHMDDEVESRPGLRKGKERNTGRGAVAELL